MTSLLLAVIVAAPGFKDKPKGDQPPSGIWVAERMVQNGTDLIGLIGGCILTFDGNVMTMRVDNQDTPIPVSFDATAKIKEMNLEYDAPRGPLRAIYKIEDDTLTICISEKPDGPRPAEFKADAKDMTLWVLKRAKK